MERRIRYWRFIIYTLTGILSVGCNSAHDTRVNASKEISELHKAAKKNISDSSWIYLKQAEKLIAQMNPSSDSLEIENLYTKGYYFMKTKQNDSASTYYHAAVNRIDSANFSLKYYPYFRNSWNTDYKLERYSNSSTTAFKYIDLIEKSGNGSYKLEYAYFLLAQIQQELKNDEKERFYYQEALNKAKKSKNDYMIRVISLSLLRKIHRKKPENAFQYLDSLLQEDNTDQINRGLQYIYGVLKFYDENYLEAINHYQNELYFIKKDTASNYFDYDMTYGYGNIAQAYIELKNYKQAQIYLDSAVQYLNQNSGSGEFKFIGEQQLALEYGKGSNLSELTSFFERIVDIQSRSYQEKMNEELQSLQFSNEKQKILEREKQQTEIDNIKLKFGGLLAFIMTILIAVFAYILYKRKQFQFKQESLQMQQRLLRSQMNPHFTSNTLYAIQNEVKKDSKSSINYLTKFSRLLRLVLENSMEDYVSLDKEIESLKKYMDLQLLRFPEKFMYTFDMGNLDIDLITIPPMLIQPFVENSIEHGFSELEKHGEIKISITRQNKFLRCIIEDNGKGIDNLNSDRNASTSIQLISDFLFKMTKMKLSIQNRKEKDLNTTGTSIDFLIPYKTI